MKYIGFASLILVLLLMSAALVFCGVFWHYCTANSQLSVLDPISAEQPESVSTTEAAMSKRILDPFTVQNDVRLEMAAASESENLSKTLSMKENAELCSFTSDRLLNTDDLISLEQSILENIPYGYSAAQFVYFEILAKNGYTFSDSIVEAYFESKEWYTSLSEKSDNINIIMGRLNQIEQQNLVFLEQIFNAE